ncbi:hypothetical protein N480_19330 [Pseudoalteromonas luteoviolacea S2607]|uniref:TonB-dependent receptor n=1 Tax=Pseudoalteromonas luteoviolacea TaxID=43657 RepID=UPI0007B05878|nr:TonB-dependent receptor [Pseudoalteromonas luteoviolacea]KZN35198.1 hypothetical protein N480_19330 [Pseudoalteromonas luteoviolacea S2607]
MIFSSRNNQFLITSALIGAFIFAQNAYSASNKSQEDPNTNPHPDSPKDPLIHIQIRGFHDSVVKSLNNKRYSQQISDSISAQEIGKFPDKNVAEALQRITGISLSRVQGEGERIGVRGTTPEQNRTYLNGQYLASADWWISSLPSRGFNFTLLPADIVSSLEIYKTPHANQDEGSLGGAINIKTIDPLYAESGTGSITTQVQYNDLSKQYDPQFSAVYSWKNQPEDFAFLITLNHLQRSLRRDGLESWGWHERNFDQTSNGQLAASSNPDATFENIWTPGGGGSAVFLQDRVLTSLTSSITYQLDHNWALRAHLLHSELSADNSNQNFLWQPGKALDAQSPITNYEIRDNTLVYGQLGHATSKPFNTSMEAIWREAQIQTQSFHLDLNYTGPWWDAQYQVGYTLGQGGTSEDNTAQFSANTVYSFDTRAPQNIQTRYETSPLQADKWFISEARSDSQDGNDTAYFIQKDFSRTLTTPGLEKLSFGGKYKRHKRDFIRMRSNQGGLDGLAAQLGTSLADYPAPFVDNYLQGIGNAQTLKRYSFANISALEKDFSALQFVQNEEKNSRFYIEEETLAGYSMLTLGGSSYSANLGLRLVKTWQQAQAYERIATLPDTTPDYHWQTNTKSYTDLLPSVNLQVDLTDSLIGRFAVARVMSRAQFHHLMPSTNYNVTQAQGQGGNPDLDPYRATQYDVSLEWYFAEAALASMAIFNKDVESFIEFKRQLEVHEGVQMSIDRPINGNGGTIRGVELSYQQAIAYGFGLIANYTYVDGSRTSQLSGLKDWIPGTSKHSANLTAYYENNQLSIRLAYNYRTEFATGVGETKMDDYGQLDGNITYSLTDNLDLVFEFLNLGDETIYTYDRNEYAPTAVYRNGRRFYLGAQYRFSTH